MNPQPCTDMALCLTQLRLLAEKTGYEVVDHPLHDHMLRLSPVRRRSALPMVGVFVNQHTNSVTMVNRARAFVESGLPNDFIHQADTSFLSDLSINLDLTRAVDGLARRLLAMISDAEGALNKLKGECALFMKDKARLSRVNQSLRTRLGVPDDVEHGVPHDNMAGFEYRFPAANGLRWKPLSISPRAQVLSVTNLQFSEVALFTKKLAAVHPKLSSDRLRYEVNFASQISSGEITLEYRDMKTFISRILPLVYALNDARNQSLEATKS